MEWFKSGRSCVLADNFNYKDPIDGCLTSNQGLRILLDNGNRVILRLSGTGTKGATLRIYLEKYIPKEGDLNQDSQKVLSEMINDFKNLADISQKTGMSQPTVIT